MLYCERDKSFSNEKNNFNIEYKDSNGSENGIYHIHDNYEVLLCMSDGMQCDTESETIEVSNNSVLLFNSVDIHHFHPKSHGGKNRRYVLTFNPSYIIDIAPEGTNLLDCFLYRPFEKAMYLPLESEQFDEVEALMKRLNILKNHSAEDLSDKEVLQKLVLEELLIVINGYYRLYHNISKDIKNSKFRYINDVVEFINSNYTNELSLDVLAKKFYVNKCNLCEHFKQITGDSPNNYIINCRLAKAKTLLISGASVENACSKSGFNNLSHFSRLFKQRVGQSPKQFQMSMSNANIREEKNV